MTAAFGQPIEMRLNEMIAGVRGDVAVKIFGDDLEVLRELSGQVQGVFAGIRGAAEIAGEQLTGQPVLQVAVNAGAIGRHGLPGRPVLKVVEAVGGLQVGEVREGQRRFPLVVRLPDRQRTDPEALAATLISTATGPVLVTFIQQRIADGTPLLPAVREGCLVRLRPVLMTALVAAVGFVPMAVNVGVGGEVQRPLATVVIGGILTNTLLTLLVLPALYSLGHARRGRRTPVSREAKG